jgi:hypothetical protein
MPEQGQSVLLFIAWREPQFNKKLDNNLKTITVKPFEKHQRVDIHANWVKACVPAEDAFLVEEERCTEEKADLRAVWPKSTFFMEDPLRHNSKKERVQSIMLQFCEL